jgi:hypothetical protein
MNKDFLPDFDNGDCAPGAFWLSLGRLPFPVGHGDPFPILVSV